MPSMAHSTTSPDVAGLEEFGRVKAHAHTGGGAGGDDGARQQRHAGGQLLQDLADGGDQQGGVGLLPQLPVDAAGDLQRRGIGDLVGGHQHRAHGGGAVQALAEVPLLVAGLQVPGGHVVEDRVAEDAVRRIGGLHVPGGPAQHHRQLRLVVQTVRETCVAGDDAVGLSGLADPLGEVHGHRPLLPEGVGAVPGGLLRVGQIIHAQAQHVLPGAGDGGQQLHVRQRQRAAALRRGDGGAQVCKGHGLDQGVHIRNGEGQDAGSVLCQGAHVFGAVLAIGDQLHNGLSFFCLQPGTYSAHSSACWAMSSGMVMPSLAAVSEFTYRP